MHPRCPYQAEVIGHGGEDYCGLGFRSLEQVDKASLGEFFRALAAVIGID